MAIIKDLDPSIIEALEEGRVADAIDAWRDDPAVRGLCTEDHDPTLIAADLLLARLQYLRLISASQKLDSFIAKVRAWIEGRSSIMENVDKSRYGRFVLAPPLLTGHPIIDKQHLMIVEIFNDIADALNEDVHEKIPLLSQKFVDSVNKHFSSEEEILRAAGYPALQEMVKAHDVFRDKEGSFVDAFRQLDEGAEDGHAIYEDFLKYFLNEEMVADLSFVPFLAEKGLTQRERK